MLRSVVILICAVMVTGVAACGGDVAVDETTTANPPSTLLQVSTTTGTSLSQGPSTTNALPAGWSRGLVVHVVDGDTIDIRLEAGDADRVRLIGINSPEGGECYATEATAGLAELIDGQTVYLEPDVTDRDQFDRLLRYVWTTELTLVNLVAVEEGWALAREYPPDTTHSVELNEAEQRASSGGVGLWAPQAPAGC